MGNWNKERTQILILGICLTVLLYLIYNRTQERKLTTVVQSSIAQPNHIKKLERVNEHLFQTSENERLAREKIELELADIRRKIETGEIKKEPTIKPSTEKSFNYDVQENHYLQDNGLGAKPTPAPRSPTDLVQEEIKYRQAEHLHRSNYEKKYFQQVVESARKQGWEIEVTDDGRLRYFRPKNESPQSGGENRTNSGEVLESDGVPRR